jgi:biotin carboxyl carrier protein
MDRPLRQDAPMKYQTRIGEQTYEVEVLDERHLVLNGTPYEVDFASIGDQAVFSLLINGRSYEAHAVRQDDGWQILLHGEMYEATVEDEQAVRARALARPGAVESGEYSLRSPMPGLIVRILASVGQTVEKGAPLVILESMKMQNELRSQKAGTVREIRIEPNQTVEQNQVLIVIG